VLLYEHLIPILNQALSAFAFDSPPTQIVLDENYDVFRKLTVPETPPTIERLITDEKSIIVSSPSNMPLYAELTKAFGDKGAITTFMIQRPDVSRKFERGGGRKIFIDPGAKGFEHRPGREVTGKERKKGRISSNNLIARPDGVLQALQLRKEDYKICL